MLHVFDGIEFDEATHAYTVNGEGLPSVTQILSDLGEISEFSTASEYRRDVGIAVHAAAALLPDRLDWSSVGAESIPYLLSLQLWFDATGNTIQAQEQRGANKNFGYAGTLDLRVLEGVGQLATLYLQGDGSMAKIVKYDNTLALKHTFSSFVNVWNWKYRGNNGRKQRD